MAIFSLNIAKISKSGGRSVMSAAAYQHRAKMKSALYDKRFDYRYKAKYPHESFVMLPKYAPKEFLDSEVLWNSVEKVEKASNALLARRFIIIFPMELTKDECVDLITEYCNSQFVSEGMVADVSIHWDEGNWHAHVLTTTRPFKENGTWAAKEKKVYALDENGERIPLLDENGNQKLGKRNEKLWKRETVEAFAVNHTNMAEEWRKAWADMANKALEKYDTSIDHRSYERQGVDVEPTVHHGGNPRLKALNEVIMAGRKKIERLLEQLKALRKETEKKEITVTIPWKNFDATAGLPMVDWNGKSLVLFDEEYHRVDDGWNIEITLKDDEMYKVLHRGRFTKYSADEVRELLSTELPPLEPQQRQTQRQRQQQRQMDDDFEL